MNNVLGPCPTIYRAWDRKQVHCHFPVKWEIKILKYLKHSMMMSCRANMNGVACQLMDYFIDKRHNFNRFCLKLNL